MISPEILRRYPFFAGLTHDNLVTLANTAKEISVEQDQYLFHEGGEVRELYLVLEGAISVVMELPLQDSEHAVSDQLVGALETEAVVLSAIGPGEVFGWSGLVPPYQTMAGAKTLTSCRIVVFNCEALQKAFEDDCQFGFLMMQKVAQVIRERLRDRRMESLAHSVA
ncbi:MAG: Crp/Fnr family transcriptional regulator [Chloroflexi bacterium]|nr:Crp/Fnr family transcriptional regulator [Chloroflexota bacterium]